MRHASKLATNVGRRAGGHGAGGVYHSTLCIENNEVKQWRAAHGERLLISAVNLYLRFANVSASKLSEGTGADTQNQPWTYYA